MEKDLTGNVYVFTGIRDKQAQESIELFNGRVSGDVSSKTTHLVCKVASNSSKFTKAEKLGIKIITIEELRQELGLD